MINLQPMGGLSVPILGTCSMYCVLLCFCWPCARLYWAVHKRCERLSTHYSPLNFDLTLATCLLTYIACIVLLTA